MNDMLQNTLAELAGDLGTSTGELWSWLQGEGVQAYAKVQVARLTAEAWGIGIALALVLVVVFAVWRIWAKSGHYDGADFLVMEAIPSTALLILGVCETTVVSDLVGWMASPEGMVLMKAMEALKG